MPRPIALLACVALFAGVAHAQDCPIANALAASDADVRAFDTHATVLASPAMAAREDGSGQNLAGAYIERAMAQAGLAPAFGTADQPAWRQAIAASGAHTIAGRLPGRGNLASQWLVVGVGLEGNPAGVAALLGMARALADESTSESGPRRGVLFIAFGGEPGGLPGAQHYAASPIAPITTHTLMLDLGPIDRLEGGRLAVSGVGSAVGLGDILAPHFDASTLHEQTEPTVTGGGVSPAFYEAGVPVLHVSQARDSAGVGEPTINRTQGAATARVLARIVGEIAKRPENLTYVGGQRPAAGTGMGDIRVRFGIRPGNYEEGVRGVAVGGITPNSPADFAGLRAGDVLVAWNGHDVGDVRDWMGHLARHEPGDVVTVTVLRDGKHLDLKVTLEGRGGI